MSRKKNNKRRKYPDPGSCKDPWASIETQCHSQQRKRPAQSSAAAPTSSAMKKAQATPQGCWKVASNSALMHTRGKNKLHAHHHLCRRATLRTAWRSDSCCPRPLDILSQRFIQIIRTSMCGGIPCIRGIMRSDMTWSSRGGASMILHHGICTLSGQKVCRVMGIHDRWRSACQLCGSCNLQSGCSAVCSVPGHKRCAFYKPNQGAVLQDVACQVRNDIRQSVVVIDKPLLSRTNSSAVMSALWTSSNMKWNRNYDKHDELNGTIIRHQTRKGNEPIINVNPL